MWPNLTPIPEESWLAEFSQHEGSSTWAKGAAQGWEELPGKVATVKFTLKDRANKPHTYSYQQPY